MALRGADDSAPYASSAGETMSARFGASASSSPAVPSTATTSGLSTSATATSALVCLCGGSLAADVQTSEFLLECHYCGSWFHGKCVQVSELDAMAILKFACPTCAQHGHATVRYQDGLVDLDGLAYAPLPMQRRQSSTTDYASPSANHSPSPAFTYRKNSELFRRTLRSAVFARSGVRVVSPQEFVPSYFKYQPLDAPLLVLDNNWGIAGLMKPLPAITVDDISALLTQPSHVCVLRGLDVGSQQTFPLSAADWSARMAHRAAPDAPWNAQFRVLETPFRHEVAPPVAVSAVDWHYALSQCSGGAAQTPNPELYGTLCGTGTFFDFTIAPDCQASWLAVSSGELTVFLIAPSTTNLQAFRHWVSGSNGDASTTIFLAERVTHCIKCHVRSGSSMVIPSGWIFALYADECSSFFSGHFGATQMLPSQLTSWLDLDRDDHALQAWRERSIAYGWHSVLSSLPPPASIDTRLWSLIYFYLNQLSHGGTSLTTSTLEMNGLRESIPWLREWNRRRAVRDKRDEGDDNQQEASWESSSRDASSALDRLQQLLGSPSNHSAQQISHTDDTDISNFLYASDENAWHHSHPSTASNNTAPNGLAAFSAPAAFASTPNEDLWAYSQYSHSSAASSSDGHPMYYHPQLMNHSAYEAYDIMGPHANNSHMYAGYMDPMHSSAPSGQPAASSGNLIHGAVPFVDVSNNLGSYIDPQSRHRASCHRCGNLRKKNVRCPNCPHIFCQKCAEKMVEEHGDNVFVDGCPFHCYKKCPSTKRPPT
ncbi:hypothetical protein ATCC90586_009574 [Pythium insidiosum]|nr:hypothetical protein ATCC90586_009574 [Pythium insidiosum]